MRIRSATPRLAACVLTAIVVAACQHVPPAPIDAGASGARLVARSLTDPSVGAALAGHDLRSGAQRAWTLDELTLAAWALRADVSRARAEVELARAQGEVAGQRINPTLTTTTERVTNGAAHPWVAGPALAFTLELGGKRGIRRARALAAQQAVEWQFGEALWLARADVRRAYLDHAQALELVDLDERDTGLRVSYLEWVDTLLTHGAAASQQRLLAQQAVSEIESRLELDRAALATSAARLAAAIGVSVVEVASIETAAPAFERLPALEARDVDAARDLALANRLDVRRGLAEYEIAEQDLRAAVASQYPNLTLAPGTLVDQADHKITLALDLPVPLLHDSSAAIRQAVAARSVAAARFEEIQSAALAEIETGFAQFRALREALAAAERGEREAQDALAVTRRQFELGGASRGDVLSAELALATRQRSVFDARRALLDAVTVLENGIERPLFPESAIETTAELEDRLASTAGSDLD